ncbi:hypothetical protein SAMN04488018_11082 [Myroides marinus]|uniref:Uncharacterized protein n=1 Tax=Myroides marinus TaxID=703342 RepID=A0A1H6VL30_9FLAO|nr:hypothetical protein [Myroides marinus]SEJ05369.1 hypothetical protein SAMN04488018_11082 [Myroides marinus]
MRKKVLFGYSKIYYCLLVLLLNQLCFGQNKFPYFNTGQSEEGFKKLGESKLGLITYGPNGIKLVDNTSQFAGVALNDLSFSTEKGFILEFEFALDMGTTFSGRYGDGIAMVLYNSSLTQPVMGDKGGALGYAHTRKSSGVNIAGFTNGFLGLGLDLFGNYKNIMNVSDEIRNGIVAAGSSDSNEGNFVVLRGPTSLMAAEGYPVLFAIQTEQGKNKNLYLDRSSGTPVTKQRGLVGQRFNLRGNVLNAKPGDTGYRKAIISLVPGVDVDANNESGFFITVEMINDSYNSTVIKNYFIPKNGNIKYTEQTTTSSSIVKNLFINTPTELKMAFTASTGGASIRAHIRNIALSLPFSPVANDMSVQGVLIDAPNTIKPLYLAYGYNSNVYSVLNPPIKSFLYLDKKSFRFKKYDPVSKQPVLTPDNYTLNEPGIGIFKYDENTGEITFTPETGFKGDAPYTFYYDIKNVKPASGTDISTEEYRSRTAAITLNFVKKGTGVDVYPTLIINRGLKNTKN